MADAIRPWLRQPDEAKRLVDDAMNIDHELTIDYPAAPTPPLVEQRQRHDDETQKHRWQSYRTRRAARP